MRSERNLIEILALHDLKARYCRFVDTKQWNEFRDCLTENFSATFDGLPRPSRDLPSIASMQGRDRIIDLQSAALEGVITIHQVFSPEIHVEGDDSATGIWAMRDHVRMPTCIFTGYGHYHERYVKSGGIWRIHTLEVTRTYVQERWK